MTQLLTTPMPLIVMATLDWIILAIPFMIVLGVTLYSRRFVKGVADFLAAGRVAGRYVVCVAGAEASMGLITVIAIFEQYYKVGFAVGHWGGLVAPVGLIITLTGFCIYRFRETRAMTMGQFFEIRYSRRFRIFTGSLQSLSGILNYGLFPAVGARFLVYFLDLPQHFMFLGLNWPTFAVVMFVFLSIGVLVSTMGGQITIMTSDCVMGILSYPMYVVVVLALFSDFSWWDQMAPSLMDRPEGESMLNPFDTYNLRDFNLFFIGVGIIGSIYNKMSWSGTQGYNAAAINAHEQKMGSILGVWKGGFSYIMIILLAVAAYTYMHHSDYSERAQVTEAYLTMKALEDVAPNLMPVEPVAISDAVAIEAWKARVKAEDPVDYQTFETIYKQMRVPSALKDILPVGILGTFCAIMIFSMISTDSTYLHSWGAIIVQDLVMPLRKRAFTPRQQLFWLRLVIVLVATYAFFFSLYFGQFTYILMFFALTGSVYVGGAGSVIIGGLYWKGGRTSGAWAAMLVGASIAACGFFFMNFWVGSIYPWLSSSSGLLNNVTAAVHGVSSYLEPIVLWRVTPDRFFMNGVEISFLTMVSSISAYVSISLLSGILKKDQDFVLDRMLHRGEFAREGVHATETSQSIDQPQAPWWKCVYLQLSGINEEFTRGDKIISWSVIIWSLGWGFGVSFLFVTIWNLISPWPDEYWVRWFFISKLVIGSTIGIISTFWFAIGGTLDLRKMFKRLAEREVDVRDDGRVIDHQNIEDVEGASE